MSKASGDAKVFIQSRTDAVSSGTFQVKISVQFDPAVDAYPNGSISITSDLSDSADGTYEATSIELVNSYGKHNPTIILTGRCKSSAATAPTGLRYWLIIANNKHATQAGTADIIGFEINDRNGGRIAYGMGPVSSGDIAVSPA